MFEEQKIKEINQAVLVGLNCPGLSPAENASEDSLEELAALLDTAGGTCLGTVLQNKNSPDPRTFIGEGKVAEIKQLVEAQGADMVIFDNALSPSQQRVLSQELKVEVTVSPDPVNCVALGTAMSLRLGDKLETGFMDATPRMGRR